MTDNTEVLMVSPGEGRVFRCLHHIGYSTAPIEGLYETIVAAENDPSQVFKQLATLIVQRGFSVPSFVVVRLDDNPAAFVFGDIRLATAKEETTIGGSASATWAERQLSAHEVTYLQTGNEPASGSSESTTLLLGNVPGDGFSYGNKTEQQTEDEVPEESWTPPEPEQRDLDDDDPVRVDPDFNPFADPADIDLEQLGSTPVSVEPAAIQPDVAPTAAQVPRPATKLAPSLEVDDLTMAQPNPPVAAHEATVDDSASLGILRFDDGQVHELTQSLLVGRYPTKNGLPEGYDSIVIRGEHVSRIHWELQVENGEALAIDLGSTSGTSIEQPAGEVSVPLVHGEPRVLSNGARIIFGDRWVSYESLRG